MSALLEIINETQANPRLKHVEKGSFYELSQVFPLSIVSSKIHYNKALKFATKLALYLNEKKDEGASRYLKSLSKLIKDYEQLELREIDVKPVEMIEYLMELQSMKQKDLVDVFGSQPHVSQILSGKRKLSVDQIKKLANKFKVNESVFL